MTKNWILRPSGSMGRSFLCIGVALLVAACASVAAPAGGPLEVSDGLGRAVALDGPARRIVSLAPSNTEILFALGAGHQVVGRDQLSDHPADALEIESIGSTFGELNTEAIVALEPDLVLAASITAPEQIQALESLGLTVYVLANPQDFDGLYANLEAVGELVDHRSSAAALVEELRARVDAVAAATDAVEPRLTYFEVDGSDPTAPWTTGAGTFQQLLIQLAGGKNVAESINGWGQISLEQLVQYDPAVMIFGEGPFIPTTVDSVGERAGWSEIAAVANGRVVPIDSNWIDRPGPRLVDALEAMAKAIHPEQFD